MINDCKETNNAEIQFLEKIKTDYPELQLEHSQAWVNPKYPWASCHPDALLVDKNFIVKYVIEYKTFKKSTSLDSAKMQLRRSLEILEVENGLLFLYNTTTKKSHAELVAWLNAEPQMPKECLSYIQTVLSSQLYFAKEKKIGKQMTQEIASCSGLDL